MRLSATDSNPSEMEIRFLDTSVIIRHLTQDHPEHSMRARQIFLQVERGDLVVMTCEGVLVEVVQVLSSPRLYHLARLEICRLLSQLLSLPGLKLSNKRAYLQALERYAASTLDFVDCLEVAHMERLRIDTIVSFDRDFDKIAGVTRLKLEELSLDQYEEAR
ncbi:MAG: PIN domain-containing protein [Chloroflexota bacterium]